VASKATTRETAGSGEKVEGQQSGARIEAQQEEAAKEETDKFQVASVAEEKGTRRRSAE
jgi:hypothetical protein